MKVHFLLSITISRLYFIVKSNFELRHFHVLCFHHIDWIASNQIKASLRLNFLQIISLRL